MFPFTWRAPLAPLASSARAYTMSIITRNFSVVAAALTAPLASASPQLTSGASSSLLFPPAPRLGAKDHFKRASEVMASVRADAVARMAVKMAGFRAPLSDFRVGDAVLVTYAQEIAETNPLPIRGTVMSKSNKGVESKFTIINVRRKEKRRGGWEGWELDTVTIFNTMRDDGNN